MKILGINCFMHDSAAALLVDGKLIAFAEEERFNRIKHTTEFPSQAIDFCLAQAGLKNLNEIDCLTFFWKPWKGLLRRGKQFLQTLPFSWNQTQHRSSVLAKMFFLPQYLKENYGYCGKIHFIEHYLCHAASAFYPSPFEEAAILIADGNGEVSTTFLGYGAGNKIQPLMEIPYPHSLGLFYLCLTEYLGFRENYEEGKVMGLAPYGEPIYAEELRKIFIFLPNGQFRLDLSYFDVHLQKKNYVSAKFIKKFGVARKREQELQDHHKNMAASLQKVLEEAALHICHALYAQTKSENLCLAGGVALNSVMNGVLIRQSAFKKFFIQPAANDAGTALGGALYQHFKNSPSGERELIEHAFWGSEFSENRYLRVLQEKHLKFSYHPNIAAKTALLLAEEKIIGWFQGRLEVGPRALGNRSILADPRPLWMKDHLNAQVKHREAFRPFAPAVLEEKASDWFEIAQPSPFMLRVHPACEKAKKLIPAVIHVDGSARIQTVSRKVQLLFWELIQEFEKITGVPVILNTSFNLRGQPIVATPEEAVEVFLSTKMDALVLGNYLILSKDS